MAVALRLLRSRPVPQFVAAFAVLALLAACSAQGSSVDESADPQPTVVDLGSLPAPSLSATWQKTYDGPVQVTLASDGSVATVLGPDGLSVLAHDGTSPWQGGTGGMAIALRSGLVVRGPGPTDGSGEISLFDPNGNLLWQQAGVGPIAAAGSPDGNRVAIADDGAGVVWFIDSNPADAPATATKISIAGPASLAFTASDRLVLDDGTQVSLISRSGGVQALCPGGCSGPSRDVAVAHNGAWLAVATRGGDNTLYMFKSDGTALWHRSLPGGGSNGVAVAPGDRQVLLYGLGTAGGLADIAASSGAERWALDLQSGGAPVPAIDAVFRPNGGMLVVAQNDAATYVVALSASGKPLTALPLPAGVAVAITGTRDAALVSSDNTSGSVSVAWYGSLSSPAP
jgi:DNA-binding beta-propeller fold protein YncE